MPSVIDLRDGKIVIGESEERSELSKAELSQARNSHDVVSLLLAKTGKIGRAHV